MDTAYLEDEEDVVLPNSPLYEHLKDAGFEDPYHEGDKMCGTLEGNVETSKRKKSSDFDWNKVQAWIVKMKNIIFCMFKDFLESMFLPELTAMQNKFKKEILQTVMDGGLLIEEDTTFLKAYTSDDFKDTGKSCGSKLWLLQKAAVPLLLLLLLFFSCGIPPCLPVNSSNFILLEMFMKLVYSVSAFLLVLYSLRTLLFFSVDVRSKSALKNLRHMYATLKELSSSFRKCIRIIQEAEMIARGFTLVSVSGLAQRLELSVDLPVLKPNRQYPEFRKSLFSWLKNIFIKHKEAALTMINCLPLSTDFDCYSHYIATLNLEDYGDILSLDMVSPESFNKLLEVTDNLSLSCLKSVLQLAEVQISEYLKLIYLYAHFIFKGKSVQLVIFEFRNLMWLNDVLSELLKYNSDTLLKVKETHKYYQSIEESTHLKGDISSPESDNTSFGGLKVCVHSLSLHLKAALKRVIDMEDGLYSEEMKLKDLNDPAVEMTLKEIAHLMSEAKAELDSSKECLVDSCEKLNSLFPQEKKVDEVEVPMTIKLPEPVCAQPVQIIPNSDPVPEDEVFEAFISGSKNTEENDHSSDWFETEVKQHREVEASSRMMRELRVVLASKAEEHRAREQLALNLKYGKEVGNENMKMDGLPTEQDERNSCDEVSENEPSSDLNSNFANTVDETCENKTSFDFAHKSHTQGSKDMVSSSMLQNDDLSNLQSNVPSSKMPDHRTGGENLRIPKYSSDLRVEGERTEYNFYPVMGKSFASSIAALAAKRNQLCGLGPETFVGDSDDISDENCD